MALTGDPIASITLVSSAASVTFSGIPQTYTDLFLVATFGISANADGTRVQYNGDTATNYSNTFLTGNGSAAGSQRETNQASYRAFGSVVGPIAGAVQMGTLNIASYANTNVNKVAFATYSGAGGEVTRGVGLWRSTAAITSLRLFNINGSTFTASSTFDLYALRGA
jgi:hypothetical protein